MSTLSRRALVSSAAALPALTVPAVVAASTEPDPIFAAIERHRQSIAPWLAAVEYEFGIDRNDPRHAEAERMTAEKQGNLLETCADLIRIYPTTIAGVVALLRYFAQSAADDRVYWPGRHTDYELDLARHAAAALERIARSP